VLADIGNMARMVEELDNIHLYMLNVFPNDIAEERVDVNRFGAALNRTKKHVMGGVYTIDGIRNVVRMGEMIAGSPEAFREKPFLSMVACVISPMKLDEKYGGLAMEAARHGVPVIVPSEPLCGATSPITLAGNVVVWTVDTLTGVMLTQLVRPGTPVLCGCVASITDMRDLKYLSGAVEMGLINAAAAQMAHHYGIPIYTTAGMSDSKTVDAQAGYESATTTLMVALAGGNFIHDAAGFLEFCMTASFDKLVVDNEIIGMVMRAVSGIEVNDDTLAFEMIKEAGPGGHFVSSRHTRKFMRTELYQPTVSDRENREVWEENGRKDTLQRAAETAQRILGSPPEATIPEDIRSRIKQEIPGIEQFIMD
jgi:trimethylamine--corrinoid protein Co-methyltransferase